MKAPWPLILRCLWVFGLTAALSLLGCAHGGAPKTSKDSIEPPPTPERQAELDLLREASRGNREEVRRLVAQGTQIDAPSASGTTALMSAAFRGLESTVAELLELGARVDLADQDGATALHYALFQNQIPVVRLLLAAKAPLEAQDSSGLTPLMLAARFGSAETVELLLKAGAQLETQDDQGWTALFFAVHRGSPGQAELLLKAGAKVNHQSLGTKQSPLGEAVYLGHRNMIQLLLQYKADAHLKDAGGKSPLDLAKEQGLPRSWLELENSGSGSRSD